MTDLPRLATHEPKHYRAEKPDWVTRIHRGFFYAVGGAITLLPWLDATLAKADQLPPWVNHDAITALGIFAVGLHYYAGRRLKQTGRNAA